MREVSTKCGYLTSQRPGVLLTVGRAVFVIGRRAGAAGCCIHGLFVSLAIFDRVSKASAFVWSTRSPCTASSASLSRLWVRPYNLLCTSQPSALIGATGAFSHMYSN